MTPQHENIACTLPPCKDIIKEATGVGSGPSIRDLERITEYQISCAIARGPPGQTLHSYRLETEPSDGAANRAYIRTNMNDESVFNSLPAVTPRKPNIFPKTYTRKRDNLASQYHPYRRQKSLKLVTPSDSISSTHANLSALEDSAYSGDRMSSANRQGVLPDPCSFHKQPSGYYEEEPIMTPLTPLTHHSEDIHILKEDSPLFDTPKPNYYQQSSGGASRIKDTADMTKAARRRKAHLQSEQRRREHIKDGMDRLVLVVPACQDGRDTKGISKATILRHAYEYIYQLRSDIHTLKQLNASKDRELSDLRKKFRISESPSAQLWQPLN